MADYEPITANGRTLRDADRSHFHVIPNIIEDDPRIDAAAYRVYGHYRRIAGEFGAFWRGAREVSAACGISHSTATKAKNDLVAAGYITATIEKRGTDGRLVEHIRIVDVWAENSDRYSIRTDATVTLYGRVTENRVDRPHRVTRPLPHTDATVTPPVTTKKNPTKISKKNQEEELTPSTGEVTETKKKKATKPLEEILSEIMTEFKDRWNEEHIRQEAAFAQSHKAANGWTSVELGLKRWFRRQAKWDDERGATNGRRPGIQGRPTPGRVETQRGSAESRESARRHDEKAQQQQREWERRDSARRAAAAKPGTLDLFSADPDASGSS